MRTLVPLALCLILLAPAAWAKSLKRYKQAIAAAVQADDASSVEVVFAKLAEVDSVPAARLVIETTATQLHLDVSESAVKALASMKAPKVRAFLVKEVRKHKRWWVRLLLLRVLVAIDDEPSRAVLHSPTEEEHESLRFRWVDLLVKERRPIGVGALVTLLEQAEADGQDALQDHAQGALRKLTRETLAGGQAWRDWWTTKGKGYAFPAPPKPKKGKDGKKKDAEDAKDAKEEMRTLVRKRIEKRGDGSLLRIDEGDIVVVKGAYDQVEDVLDALKVPHTKIKRTSLPTYALRSHQVLILNCDGKPLPPACIARVRAFVGAGGYLFTSDWELSAVLARAFPKAVSVSKRIDESEVGISPVTAHASHPYLRDVFPRSPYRATKFRWKVDAASDLQRKFLGTGLVVPLVFSRELQKKEGVGVVAFTFRCRGGQIFGASVRKKKNTKKKRVVTGRAKKAPSRKILERRGGSVLHVLGHFVAQADPKGDGFALQQLLLNFVVEKQRLRQALAAAGGGRKKKGKKK
jgi:hypothetical protein